MPYLNGFAVKVRELKLRIVTTEQLVYHDAEGYAGKMDFFCVVNGNTPALVDLKTGAPPPSTALQTALYALALQRQEKIQHIADWRRFSIELKPERSILKEYTDPYDYTLRLPPSDCGSGGRSK